MNQAVWVEHPRIWSFAADRAAKEIPRWTRAWWRQTAETYLKMGGKFFEAGEEESGNGSTDH